MESFFLATFLFGLVFVVLSFVLGIGHYGVHIPHLSHIDLNPFDGHAPSHHVGHSPVNISTVLAFLTWFGGIGYILTVQSRLGLLMVLAVATLGGLAGAGIIFLLLARYLWPGQTEPMHESDYRLEGTLARVSVPLTGTRIGEIIYTKAGSTRSEGARSNDGSPLPAGTQVVVLRYERGIAYVEPLDKLLMEREVAKLEPGGEPLMDTREGRT